MAKQGRISPRRTSAGTKLYPGSRRRKRARPERGQQADTLIPARASTHERCGVSRGVRVKRRCFSCFGPPPPVKVALRRCQCAPCKRDNAAKGRARDAERVGRTCRAGQPVSRRCCRAASPLRARVVCCRSEHVAPPLHTLRLCANRHVLTVRGDRIFRGDVVTPSRTSYGI